MKPWPTALIERYPRHRCIPERPWWSRSNTVDGMMLFRTPGEDGIVVEWRKAAPGGGAIPPRPGNARVQFPINAQGNAYTVTYNDWTHTSISTFNGAATDFGENYDAQMPMDTEADLMKLLERLDRERPLPHPGERVGQIWANAAGGAVQISAMNWHGRPRCIDDTNEYPHTIELFSPALYPYLIADPACPHLAPWSPA